MGVCGVGVGESDSRDVGVARIAFQPCNEWNGFGGGTSAQAADGFSSVAHPHGRSGGHDQKCVVRDTFVGESDLEIAGVNVEVAHPVVGSALNAETGASVGAAVQVGTAADMNIAVA